MKYKIILFTLCVILLICGCIEDPVSMDAQRKEDKILAKYNFSVVKPQGFEGIGEIDKFYLASENLTCYIRKAGYEGGLSCFDGVR